MCPFYRWGVDLNESEKTRSRYCSNCWHAIEWSLVLNDQVIPISLKLGNQLSTNTTNRSSTLQTSVVMKGKFNGHFHINASWFFFFHTTCKRCISKNLRVNILNYSYIILSPLSYFFFYISSIFQIQVTFAYFTV